MDGQHTFNILVADEQYVLTQSELNRVPDSALSKELLSGSITAGGDAIRTNCLASVSKNAFVLYILPVYKGESDALIARDQFEHAELLELGGKLGLAVRAPLGTEYTLESIQKKSQCCEKMYQLLIKSPLLQLSTDVGNTNVKIMFAYTNDDVISGSMEEEDWVQNALVKMFVESKSDQDELARRFSKEMITLTVSKRLFTGRDCNIKFVGKHSWTDKIDKSDCISKTYVVSFNLKWGEHEIQTQNDYEEISESDSGLFHFIKSMF